MEKSYEKVGQILSTWYIFVWVFTDETMWLCKDTQTDKVRVDVIWNSLYFSRSQHIWSTLVWYMHDIHIYLDGSDMAIFEKAFQKISDLLAAPCTLTHKRWYHQDRILIQSVNTYVSRDDIQQFFAWYSVSFLSCLDPSLKPIQVQVSGVIPKPLVKRKDVAVSDSPRLCIIAPSKPAAQQLILSLHASKAYTDCLLAAEHVTWWSGKIIQQALKKSSYILIWWYGFCMQCIAHGIVFDSLCALDILATGSINPFMDISYYAASKKTS
jgi:hypothetical protein